MHSPDGYPQRRRTSWTLARDGHRLACTLITMSARSYVLRLTYDGQRILDERCKSPHHAVERSLEAFRVLVSRGWLHEHVAN